MCLHCNGIQFYLNSLELLIIFKINSYKLDKPFSIKNVYASSNQ